MKYLINEETQRTIANSIDRAVKAVLAELPNHGTEEGLTPVLGHALMQQSFKSPGLSVAFNYRQLNKHSEEPHAGADGGFLVRVRNKDGLHQKAALFQAKLLKDNRPTRDHSMRFEEARRLQEQSSSMLAQTNEAVAIFYTHENIYVVDAEHYRTGPISTIQRPLAQRRRLITLGTYLGRWLPRCTRGDQDQRVISCVEHMDGFKKNLTMDIITNKPSIQWKNDTTERHWQKPRHRIPL
ncbi:MAG: hypothetical protein EOO71_41040 [Myxococcaceae bacterium]|nr:MAG: hypothetical protein EOO71_41040 [Myxococcaceae bacterium]